MRESRFWELMDDEFGPGYARSVAGHQVLGAVGDRTADEALAAGVPAREVWTAVCDQMGIPPQRRLGADKPAGEARPDDV